MSSPPRTCPSFGELGLPNTLVSALSRRGIDTPFPIQAATIPDALAGRDLLGRAATGSGKTLAFGLPLSPGSTARTRPPRRPRGLVLVPTRELAMQVTDALTPLAHARGLSVRLVAGGLPINKQIQSLEKGVDILVATPGRLEDLIERRVVQPRLGRGDRPRRGRPHGRSRLPAGRAPPARPDPARRPAAAVLGHPRRRRRAA